MPGTPRNATALVREQLRGEKQRAVIVLVVFGVLGLVGVVATSFMGNVLGEVTGDPRTIVVLAVAFVGFLAFEGTLAFTFAQAEHRALIPPRSLFVVSTVVEALAPSILIFLLSGHIAGGQAVDAPPLLIYFVLIILSTLRLDPGLSVLTGAVCGVGYLVVGLAAMDDAAALGPDRLNADALPHVARAVMMVAAGVLAAFVSREILDRQRLAEQLREERRNVVDVFGRHVSPQVVDTLLAEGSEPVTETREVCVVFLDIRDFTTFSETRTPDEVVAVLNALFEPLVDVVIRWQGIVNKFLGDGFMAVFGAPLHDTREVEHAVRASLEMLEVVDGLRADASIPNLDVGIAVHAGTATVGTVGSLHRKEYTVIGDTVNVASRVEGLNKRFGSRLLATAEVWDSVRDAFDDVVAEEMEPTTVKGRARPVRCYRLVPTGRV